MISPLSLATWPNPGSSAVPSTLPATTAAMRSGCAPICMIAILSRANFDADLLQRHFHGEMAARAEGADGNAFPSHVCGLANLRPHPELVRQHLHQPGDDHDIRAAARRSGHRPDAIGGELYFPGHQRLRSHRAAAGKNRAHVESVFFKQSQVFGDPQARVHRDQSRVGDQKLPRCLLPKAGTK